MGRSLTAVLLFTAGLAISAGPAQAGRTLQVTLPFNFEAADQRFPKGRCSLDLSSTTRVAIHCSSVRSAVSATTLEFKGDAFKATSVKEITFTRYGDRYFLTEIWVATEGRRLIESEAEKALVKDGVEGTAVKLKVK